MLLLIIFLLTPVVAGLITYYNDPESLYRIRNTKANTIGFACVVILFTIVIWGASYSTWVSMQKKLATVEQYKETIELYADKGVQEFKSGSGQANELTDLKYNNYQAQIGQMIRDMRNVIVEYNKDLAAKKELKNNIFFSWCIYLPYDAKLIQMGDYLK